MLLFLLMNNRKLQFNLTASFSLRHKNVSPTIIIMKLFFKKAQKKNQEIVEIVFHNFSWVKLNNRLNKIRWRWLCMGSILKFAAHAHTIQCATLSHQIMEICECESVFGTIKAISIKYSKLVSALKMYYIIFSSFFFRILSYYWNMNEK